MDAFGNGEIGGEDDRSPGCGTTGRRRVGEALGIEIVKFEIAVEFDLAWGRLWNHDRRFDEGGVTGANDLCGSEIREQDCRQQNGR